MAVAETTENTFRKYSAEEAQRYAQHRQDYRQALYDAVLLFHASTSGKYGVLLDVGCGAGQRHPRAGHTLPPSHRPRRLAFHGAAGRRDEPRCRCHHPIRRALVLVPVRLPSLSARSSTARTPSATAAAWTSSPWPTPRTGSTCRRFGAARRRVLRPRGTVAVWVTGEGLVHPSTPGAAALDAVRLRFVACDLLPHYLPGNFLFRDRYRDLPLTWTAAGVAHGFEKRELERREWNVAYGKPRFSGAAHGRRAWT